MIHAYDNQYLDDAVRCLGEAMDYAVNSCQMNMDSFLELFIGTGYAEQFAAGVPKYVSGISGTELVMDVLTKSGTDIDFPQAQIDYDYSPQYWCGWILAYYQWITGKRFEDIVKGGLTLSKVFSMYILHEADESKFVEAANDILKRNQQIERTKLYHIRKARGFTQQQLSDASGVTLRMIQLYEQRQNDINRAQVRVVVNLAKVLGCDVEDLLEHDTRRL